MSHGHRVVSHQVGLHPRSERREISAPDVSPSPSFTVKDRTLVQSCVGGEIRQIIPSGARDFRKKCRVL
jgi:hypothetical protein